MCICVLGEWGIEGRCRAERQVCFTSLGPKSTCSSQAEGLTLTLGHLHMHIGQRDGSFEDHKRKCASGGGLEVYMFGVSTTLGSNFHHFY